MRQHRTWTMGLALMITTLLSGCVLGDDRDPTKGQGQLKLKLTTTATKVKVGDQIAILATITNTTDKPVNVPLGMSYSGVCFTNGSVLRMMPDVPHVKGEVKEIKPQWRVGFCGTGAYPLYVAVAGKGKLEYTMNGIVKEDKEGAYLNFGSATHDFLIFRLPKQEGKLTIHAEHEAKPHKGAFPPQMMGTFVPPRNVQQGWAPDVDAPVWAGTMKSNKLSLEITK